MIRAKRFARIALRIARATKSERLDSLPQDEPRLCNALFRGALRRAGNEWRLLARLASQI